jgi:hypothetical protein
VLDQRAPVEGARNRRFRWQFDLTAILPEDSLPDVPMADPEIELAGFRART